MTQDEAERIVRACMDYGEPSTFQALVQALLVAWSAGYGVGVCDYGHMRVSGDCQCRRCMAVSAARAGQ
jgi:hypothetical protein